MPEASLEPVLRPAELFDYRAGDERVPLWVPYQQGDVFEGVTIPGAPEPQPEGLAMLFMHPCTMRRGARLEDHVTVVQVRLLSKKRVLEPEHKEWSHFRRVPLPDLLADSTSHYADLMVIGTVASADLPRTRRIAQLSQEGRIRMVQRLVHHLTRFAPPTARIEQALAPVHRELELQQDWLEGVKGYEALNEEQILLVEGEFDKRMEAPLDAPEAAALGGTGTGEPANTATLLTRRDALRTDRRDEVVRAVLKEIPTHPAGAILNVG